MKLKKIQYKDDPSAGVTPFSVEPPMQRSRTLGWSITLAVVMILLLVAITVGWVVLAGVSGYWTILAVGTVFLVLVLAGVVAYLVLQVQEIRLNQRQSNFIDSVTHELKSPLASLKLYVQTLERRKLTDAQQAEFLAFMLQDLQRLDALINHLLDAARIDQRPVENEVVDVDLPLLLKNCAELACQQYRLPLETIRVDAAPAVVRARVMDVEMVFRNLIDNAIKYSGTPPAVEVDSHLDSRGRSITRISDNGQGIPLAHRRKIFRRFVRLGSELERSQQGTGLGLYIVRTLVTRMRGRVTVRSRPGKSGTTFEVELPAKVETAAEIPDQSPVTATA